MFEIDTSGFDELKKRLDDLAKNAEDIDGAHKVPVSELFNDAFMRKHTQCQSFDELIEAGGFVVNSPEDFQAIPDADWDAHVNAKTNFPNWQEMINKAGIEWTSKKLGL